MMAAMIMMGLAAVVSVQAQNALEFDRQHTVPAGQVTTGPGLPYPVYILPVRQRDDRTPRRRCHADEAARIGGTLSDLDQHAIDLKCSHR